MGLYKRGDVWWISYTYDGEQVRESSHTKSKKYAEKLLAKRQAAIFEGRYDFQDIKPSPRFSDYADEYLEAYSKVNKRPRTFQRDTILIAHLKAFFGNRRLNDIRPMLIEQYKRSALGHGEDTGNGQS